MAQRIKINERQLRGLPKFIQQQAIKAVKAAIAKSAKDAWKHARKSAESIHWERTYRRGFKLRKANDGQVVMQLYNDAPHAGVIEVGAPPHKVSQAGFHKITRWAVTKLGLSDRDARAVAMSVVKRIGIIGQPAKLFVMFAVRDTSPKIERYWKTALHKQLGRTNPQQ